MATKESMAVMELFLNIISGKTEDVSKVNYEPQKPSISEFKAPEQYFLRATPESQGVPSSMIRKFFMELAQQEETDIHHVMVLRNGFVIGECHYGPYRLEDWHITHSMCKSITGMAIGLLISEGKLNLTDRVVNIFGKRKNILNVIRKKDLTVEHLLTMTSRISFNEAGAATSNDWVKSFLESSMHGSAGSQFEYNSMNTYMLSAILTEITGETLLEYLKPRLLEPLKIERIFWEKCPKGITKGGWGLYLCPEDALKLGQLYLHKGIWEGKAILPSEWVETSTKKHVETPDSMGANGYGYQIWMGSRKDSYLFNGMLGQNVIVYPDIDMIVYTNAASREIFRERMLSDAIIRYFETDFQPDKKQKENPQEYRRLCATVKELEQRKEGIPIIRKGGWDKNFEKRARRLFGYKKRETFLPNKKRRIEKVNPEIEIASLDGICYEFEKKHVGILPLIMQVFHNNYTSGISQISFQKEWDGFYLFVIEGEVKHRIKIGFGSAEESEIFEHGEPYRIGVKGSFLKDEEEKLVLKLDIAYLEDSAKRKLKLHFDTKKETILAEWDELPGNDLIIEALESIIMDDSSLFLDFFKERGGIELCTILIERTIHPTIKGKRKEEKAWDDTKGVLIAD